ncbi:hypothetical protein [Nesterenkonia sp. HG001]|uniref:hypothetical protein n=1 Tax=Nesterenkonia sp. HG001 TaxID=2983207 RepID=UPI002AC6DA6D|nr:hypothetical protein [Nesterenkonia sp. HG001]MDZ5076758.1 hypothetical protein [Nesterenkonia sp. HG001]
MSEHTPTTEVVKHAACFPRERLGEPRPIDRNAFDRWLAGVVRDAKAEAWDKGYRAHEEWRYRQDDAIAEGQWVRIDSPRNPYRERTDDAE